MKDIEIVKTSLYLEDSLLQHLKIVAILDNVKVNDIIVKLVRDYLKNNPVQLNYEKE